MPPDTATDRRDCRLPCPAGGCHGVEIHDGKPEGCGHPTKTSGCLWAPERERIEIPAGANAAATVLPGRINEPVLRLPVVIDDGEEFVWVEVVDGVTDEDVDAAMAFALSIRELAEDPAWTLAFDTVVSMRKTKTGPKPTDEEWDETTEDVEDRRQFWRYEWTEARR